MDVAVGVSVGICVAVAVGVIVPSPVRGMTCNNASTPRTGDLFCRVGIEVIYRE